jgi:phage terminase Nu1 subunit (DNA packaging protein)
MNNHKVSDIAKILSLSERRVQQLVKEGILPTPTDGSYHLSGCVEAYQQYLMKKQLTKNGSSTDLATEKLRLLKAQADKAELELEALKGKYIEVTEVEFEWSNLLLAFRSKMLNMPSKLACTLAAAGSDFAKLEQILEDEIYEALTELGKYGEEQRHCEERRDEAIPGD